VCDRLAAWGICRGALRSFNYMGYFRPMGGERLGSAMQAMRVFILMKLARGCIVAVGNEAN
jgi:hypothetical protein